MFVYVPGTYIGTYIGMYPSETRFARIIVCCCSGRDSCMLTSRCMLPWLRSAPYPALCPCEPLGPVGDMHASRALRCSFQTAQSTAPGLQLVTSTYRRASRRRASRVLWCSLQTVQFTAPGLQLVTSIYRRASRRHASRALWCSFQTVQSTAPGLQLVPSMYR